MSNQGSSCGNLKFVLAGASYSGKSALLQRFRYGTYSKTPLPPTIGLDYAKRTVQLNDEHKFAIHVWDLGGVPSLLWNTNILEMYCKDAMVVVIAFDLTDSETFTSALEWHARYVQMRLNQPLFVLAGCKCDRTASRSVSREAIDEACAQRGITYYETSALTGHNVSEMFTETARTCIRGIVGEDACALISRTTVAVKLEQQTILRVAVDSFFTPDQILQLACIQLGISETDFSLAHAKLTTLATMKPLYEQLKNAKVPLFPEVVLSLRSKSNDTSFGLRASVFGSSVPVTVLLGEEKHDQNIFPGHTTAGQLLEQACVMFRAAQSHFLLTTHNGDRLDNGDVLCSNMSTAAGTASNSNNRVIFHMIPKAKSRQPVAASTLTDEVAQNIPLPKTKNVRELMQEFFHQRNKGRKANVLCIDGGGVRGLVALEILLAIERETGSTIAELFDMVVGTSTGGIVCLGLGCCGMSVEQLYTLYNSMPGMVFDSGFFGPLSKLAKFATQGARFSNEELKAMLMEFANVPMKKDGESDMHAPSPMVCVVSSNSTASDPEPYLFRSYKPGTKGVTAPLNGTSDAMAWEAGLATSAAHTYFPPFEYKGLRLRDGGGVANNPTEIAMKEAVDVFGMGNINCIVSVGTGGPTLQVNEVGVLECVRELVQSATSCEVVHNRVYQSSKTGNFACGQYFRLNIDGIKLNLDETRPGHIAALGSFCRSRIRTPPFQDVLKLVASAVSPTIPLQSMADFQAQSLHIMREIAGCIDSIKKSIQDFDFSLSTMKSTPQKLIGQKAAQKIESVAAEIEPVFSLEFFSEFHSNLESNMILICNFETAIAVYGDSGAGKSTFINALTGRGIMPCDQQNNPSTAVPFRITHDARRHVPLLVIPRVELYNEAVADMQNLLKENTDWWDRVYKMQPSWFPFVEYVKSGACSFRASYEGIEQVSQALTDITHLYRSYYQLKNAVHYESMIRDEAVHVEVVSPQAMDMAPESCNSDTPKYAHFDRDQAETRSKHFEFQFLKDAKFPVEFPQVFVKFSDLVRDDLGCGPVSVVDTPGINEHPYHDVTKRVLMSCNATIPILNWVKLRTPEEVTHAIQAIVKMQPRGVLTANAPIVVAVNKFDIRERRFTAKDLSEHIFSKCTLPGTNFLRGSIVPMSAKHAFWANYVKWKLNNWNTEVLCHDETMKDFCEATSGITADDLEELIRSMTAEDAMDRVRALYNKSCFGGALKAALEKSLQNNGRTIIRSGIVCAVNGCSNLLLGFSKRLELIHCNIEELDKQYQEHARLRAAAEQAKPAVERFLLKTIGSWEVTVLQSNARSKEQLAELLKGIFETAFRKLCAEDSTGKVATRFLASGYKIYFDDQTEVEAFQNLLSNGLQSHIADAIEGCRTQIRADVRRIADATKAQFEDSFSQLGELGVKVTFAPLDIESLNLPELEVSTWSTNILDDFRNFFAGSGKRKLLKSSSNEITSRLLKACERSFDVVVERLVEHSTTALRRQLSDSNKALDDVLDSLKNYMDEAKRIKKSLTSKDQEKVKNLCKTSIEVLSSLKTRFNTFLEKFDQYCGSVN